MGVSLPRLNILGANVSRMTKLTRPIVREVGDGLVVAITATGIELRGKRKRTVHRVTWEQVAALSGDDQPILRESEAVDGAEKLTRLKTPKRKRAKK